MRISHKVDYGVRAMVALARAATEDAETPVPRDTLAARNGIPPKFLDDILRELRTAGLARSRRGSVGGWTLGRPAGEITVADVVRALDGPLASVRGIRPHHLAGAGVEPALVTLWVAVRSALRSVLEVVTVADLAAGTLPDSIQEWAAGPGAWDAPSPPAPPR
ncbi:MAG: Rrf2 family transcriptional regulator [Acidimicrobiales bacterium]